MCKKTVFLFILKQIINNIFIIWYSRVCVCVLSDAECAYMKENQENNRNDTQNTEQTSKRSAGRWPGG